MLGSLKVHFSLQRSPRTSRKNIYKLIKDRNFSISWANLYFCVGWLGRTLCPRWVKYFLWRRSFPPTQIKGGNLNYSTVSIGTSTSVVDQVFGSGSWNLLQYGFGFKHFHIRLLHCQVLRTFFYRSNGTWRKLRIELLSVSPTFFFYINYVDPDSYSEYRSWRIQFGSESRTLFSTL